MHRAVPDGRFAHDYMTRRHVRAGMQEGLAAIAGRVSRISCFAILGVGFCLCWVCTHVSSQQTLHIDATAVSVMAYEYTPCSCCTAGRWLPG